MNLTKYRDHLIHCIDPASRAFARLGLTPNQVTLLSLFFGVAAGVLYGLGYAYPGGAALLVSALLDFIDGGVARITNRTSRFGAAIDWIVDKYVDGFVLIGIGIGGFVDMRLAAVAVFGSLINTFIKPVVYAEIGYREERGWQDQGPAGGHRHLRPPGDNHRDPRVLCPVRVHLLRLRRPGYRGGDRGCGHQPVRAAAHHLPL